jgi:asparagine synthetase B (glutamine-hydrolysing)
MQLRKELKQKHVYATNSDCEPIVYLYEEFGDEFIQKGMLDGDFAFLISDSEKGTYLAARDPIGVCPLYIVGEPMVLFGSPQNSNVSPKNAIDIKSSLQECIGHQRTQDSRDGTILLGSMSTFQALRLIMKDW